MAAKRRIVVLAVASVLASAFASAAVDYRARRRPTLEHIDQPTGSLMCTSSLLGAEQGKRAEAVRTSAAGSPGARNDCPAGMVEIEGDYCPGAEQICVKWIDAKRDRCERYRTNVRCVGKPRRHRFCVDKYEYPNEEGTKPVVAVTWEQAKASCSLEGKRLCTAEEWTLACEGGSEMLPYPYGFIRDPEACNIDRPYIMPDDGAYKNPRTRASEVSRLNQADPSGARVTCVSPYGVHDMTGNVDEWVVNEEGSVEGPEYQSGLKGGYWAAVRNRCRPMTTDHNAWHSGYQIGFRCCSELAPRTTEPESSGQANTLEAGRTESAPNTTPA
jgi:hypothetical protein